MDEYIINCYIDLKSLSIDKDTIYIIFIGKFCKYYI